MKTLLLGFRVVAPIGTDNFELRQSAIECAQRTDGKAYVVTREIASDGDWIDDEQLDVIWPEGS